MFVAIRRDYLKDSKELFWTTSPSWHCRVSKYFEGNKIHYRFVAVLTYLYTICRLLNFENSYRTYKYPVQYTDVSFRRHKFKCLSLYHENSSFYGRSVSTHHVNEVGGSGMTAGTRIMTQTQLRTQGCQGEGIRRTQPIQGVGSYCSPEWFWRPTERYHFNAKPFKERKCFIFYFTNGRYIVCLSLTYATDKSKA